MRIRLPSKKYVSFEEFQNILVDPNYTCAKENLAKNNIKVASVPAIDENLNNENFTVVANLYNNVDRNIVNSDVDYYFPQSENKNFIRSENDLFLIYSLMTCIQHGCDILLTNFKPTTLKPMQYGWNQKPVIEEMKRIIDDFKQINNTIVLSGVDVATVLKFLNNENVSFNNITPMTQWLKIYEILHTAEYQNESANADLIDSYNDSAVKLDNPKEISPLNNFTSSDDIKNNETSAFQSTNNEEVIIFENKTDISIGNTEGNTLLTITAAPDDLASYKNTDKVFPIEPENKNEDSTFSTSNFNFLMNKTSDNSENSTELLEMFKDTIISTPMRNKSEIFQMYSDNDNNDDIENTDITKIPTTDDFSSVNENNTFPNRLTEEQMDPNNTNITKNEKNLNKISVEVNNENETKFLPDLVSPDEINNTRFLSVSTEEKDEPSSKIRDQSTSENKLKNWKNLFGACVFCFINTNGSNGSRKLFLMSEAGFLSFEKQNDRFNNISHSFEIDNKIKEKQLFRFNTPNDDNEIIKKNVDEEYNKSIRIDEKFRIRTSWPMVNHLERSNSTELTLFNSKINETVEAKIFENVKNSIFRNETIARSILDIYIEIRCLRHEFIIENHHIKVIKFVQIVFYRC